MQFNKKTYKILLNSFLTTITLSSFISFTEKLPKRTNASNAIKFVNNNWLDKYKNYKDFINCDFFNAYKNGNLIKKVLIKQFLYQTKLAFAEFQQYILKTYSNLKFCWINEENDLSSSTKVIEFNQKYFELLNKKIDWETFFNYNTCNFNVTTNCLEKEIVSCFLCDDIKGIYYIDEKNKSNDIDQSLKKKISELKAKMNYAKKQLHAFNSSITQPLLSNNEELNSFLLQIVANARKSLNNTVMINETSNKSLSKSNKDDDYFIRKKFFDWIEDEYNITTNITVEDYALIAMNHFENFFIYLSFYKKDYLQGDEIVFDKAITDFLRITRKNFKIIVLEKAVASYILAARNNRNIVYFDLEEFIFKNWNSIMWQITGVVGAFGLGGLISSLISSTIGTTAVMGSSIPKTLASWFSNFWGGFANFFGGVGLPSGKTILINSTSIILPILLSGTAVWYTIKINKKSAQKNVENGVKINDDNVINVDVNISNETKENKINTEIEKKMIHVLSKYGKSKKNCDVDLDENMISNIDTKKIDEIKNEENVTKAQVDKNETNDQKIKNLIKQWLAKKFNKKNLTYYHENNIDWVDVENDSIFFKMIISHLKNFDKYDENGQSTIHRIPLKWVLKAISKIIKEDDEIKKMCFFDHQLTKIIFDCFTKEIRKNNIGQSDNYSNNKINILDHDKNNDETKNYHIFEKKEEESIKGIISNGNANTINNKIEDEDDNTKNKENLKIDIANRIFKMLYCVEVECEKNYLFKKNWNYSFAFKSLQPLIQNKIKDSEKEEYIHFDTLLSTIVKILKEDKQIYATFTHDELNVIIWRDLCKILEENRKLNEGKNKFIIKAKNNKNYENNKKGQFSNNNIEQKFQKEKNDNNDANDTLIKNCVVNSIIKIFNNELPIIWSDKQGNWIKVSSLPNEIKNKINIFKQNTRIKYVNLRLVLKIIIQILKEDMEINDHFLDNELEEIIVGLCNRKNIENSNFFPINHNNYESGVAKIINLLSRKIDYRHRFTGFSAHSLPSETKRIYYALNFYRFRNEILRMIENDENDRKFYNYVCSLSDQKLHNIFSYFLKQIVLFYCDDFSFQYLDDIDDFTVIDEIDTIFVNTNKIINEIINNHETEIINFSANTETKKLMCWVNYDKLQQKLYKKYIVNSKHDQILDKNNIFSKAILLPYIHNFFLQHYNNFTLDIQDMI